MKGGGRTIDAASLALAGTLLALVAASCGRVALDEPADRADASAGVEASAGAHPQGVDAHAGAQPIAPDARLGPPFALTVRLINTGADDVLLGLRPSVCSDDLLIQGGAPVEQPTSLQPADFFCDCTNCSSSPTSRPQCQSNEFICDQPPLVLRPGQHFDFPWDGNVLTWLPSPPPGTACVGRCSENVPVPAGDYVFTLVQPLRVVNVQSPLPPPGGVVEIPIGDR